MNGTAKQVGQSAKSLAQQIAKQMAREPLEVLKTAGSQVTGEEKRSSGEFQPQSQPQTQEDQAKLIHHQQEIQDKMKSSRLIEALERELGDIHKQDIFKDLQARITDGEIIPLEDYSELSMEQKQVLKAQMEAVAFQKKQQEYAESQGGGSLFGTAKKGRKMGGGQKQEAEKQQTRVEKPVPPSG
ncbi:MAG: hypothetical protein HYV90_04985 [Candidatus Woesebacteria bacterium]|nr:MAG: hypothetical protein HYV90_04985 [Candidatus Woesebacteria bacterium]